MKIRLASEITRDSIVDGPGLRAVVWAQGCSHNCPGCHNPATHDFKGGFETDTMDVIEKLASLKLQKGVTLSGGDPFFQPESMTEIAAAARAMGMNVWAYSGFTFEQLLDPASSHHEARMELLKHVDVLVDGRFEIDKRDTTLLFRGSSNQRLVDVQRSLALFRTQGVQGMNRPFSPVLYEPWTFAPVSEKDREKFLPLHFAVQRKNTRLMDFFLERGADVNARDGNGRTAMDIADDPVIKETLKSALRGKDAHMATYYRDTVQEAPGSDRFLSKKLLTANTLEEVKELMALGADPGKDLEEPGYMNAYNKFVHENRLDIVKHFISAGFMPVYDTPAGQTQLHFATTPEMADLLVKEGHADVNALTDWKWTPIFGAETPELAEKLIDLGASVFICDEDEKLPIEVNTNEAVKAVLQAEMDRLKEYSQEQLNANLLGSTTPAEIKKWLAAGADVNAFDTDPWNSNTLLMKMAARGDREGWEAVNEILKHNPDVKLQNTFGETVFNIAAGQGSVEINGLLLSQFRDFPCINEPNNLGITPFMTAALRPDGNNVAVMDLLYKNGADLSVKNKDGFNALHLACMNPDETLTPDGHQLEVIQYLADHSKQKNRSDDKRLIDLDEKFSLGGDLLTALDLVSQKTGMSKVAEALINSGAKLDDMLVQFAVIRSDLDTVKVFVNAGSPYNEETAVLGWVPSTKSPQAPEMLDFFMSKAAEAGKTFLPAELANAAASAAASHKDSLAVRYLHHGADLKYKNRLNQYNLVHYAAEFGCIQLLTHLSKAARDNEREYRSLFTEHASGGVTPIQLLANAHPLTTEKAEVMATHILANRGYINDRDDGGRTALMKAAANGNTPVLKAFLNYAPDLTIRDIWDKSALNYAIDNIQSPECALTLLDAGARMSNLSYEQEEAVFDYIYEEREGLDIGDERTNVKIVGVNTETKSLWYLTVNKEQPGQSLLGHVDTSRMSKEEAEQIEKLSKCYPAARFSISVTAEGPRVVLNQQGRAQSKGHDTPPGGAAGLSR